MGTSQTGAGFDDAFVLSALLEKLTPDSASETVNKASVSGYRPPRTEGQVYYPTTADDVVTRVKNVMVPLRAVDSIVPCHTRMTDIDESEHRKWPFTPIGD